MFEKSIVQKNQEARDRWRQAHAHRTPLHAECGCCGNIWPAVWLPMEVSQAVVVLQGQTRCPRCGRDDVRVHAHKKQE